MALEEDMEPLMDPHTHGALRYDRHGSADQWKDEELFSKRCWYQWLVRWGEMKCDLQIKPLKKSILHRLKAEMWKTKKL